MKPLTGAISPHSSSNTSRPKLRAQRATTTNTRTHAGLNSPPFPFSSQPGHFPANIATICSQPENAAPEKTAWRTRDNSNLEYRFEAKIC
jgi:hypothetical protein